MEVFLGINGAPSHPFLRISDGQSKISAAVTKRHLEKLTSHQERYQLLDVVSLSHFSDLKFHVIYKRLSGFFRFMEQFRLKPPSSFRRDHRVGHDLKVQLASQPSLIPKLESNIMQLLVCQWKQSCLHIPNQTNPKMIKNAESFLWSGSKSQKKNVWNIERARETPLQTCKYRKKKEGIQKSIPSRKIHKLKTRLWATTWCFFLFSGRNCGHCWEAPMLLIALVFFQPRIPASCRSHIDGCGVSHRLQQSLLNEISDSLNVDELVKKSMICP